MAEEYITNGEYAHYFPELGGIRQKIATDLPIKEGMLILDLATGYGYFALEVVKINSNLVITGIDISTSNVENARKNANELGMTEQLSIIQMDATEMSFPDEYFDVVINFLGLEDIHMTRGREGVEKTFFQTSRVLKPGGYFCFTVMPPEEMETRAQQLEVGIFSRICGATWLNLNDYQLLLERAGFTTVKQKDYRTGKRLTPQQAREEIQFACDNVPRIYGKATLSFEDVWEEFGPEIEKYGLGHYSKVKLLITRKGE